MADMSAESIQQKIQIARRDAEALKDRIKRKKDELADTTRKSADGRGAPHPRRCRASLLTQWHSP
jgi:guanine nucleotide-binding protein G(I)/G(S)/G(T) subunit beta-1